MKAKTAAALATILGTGINMMAFEPKAASTYGIDFPKPKREYLPEQQEILDELFKDRSSPGRKRYKNYKAQLDRQFK